MTENADQPIEFLKSFADLDDPRQQAKSLGSTYFFRGRRPDVALRGAVNMMEDVGEFTIRGNQTRTEVLQLYARIQDITAGYDGVEAYLGESFCEDEFGMVKASRGTKDVDGHVGKIAVQSKFKWLTPENFKTRYVSIREKPGFDVLIVTYVKTGESNIRLFGIWTRKQALSVAKRSAQSSLRVFLKDLKPLPTFNLADA